MNDCDCILHISNGNFRGLFKNSKQIRFFLLYLAKHSRKQPKHADIFTKVAKLFVLFLVCLSLLLLSLAAALLLLSHLLLLLRALRHRRRRCIVTTAGIVGIVGIIIIVGGAVVVVFVALLVADDAEHGLGLCGQGPPRVLLRADEQVRGLVALAAVVSADVLLLRARLLALRLLSLRFARFVCAVVVICVCERCGERLFLLVCLCLCVCVCVCVCLARLGLLLRRRVVRLFLRLCVCVSVCVSVCAGLLLLLRERCADAGAALLGQVLDHAVQVSRLLGPALPALPLLLRLGLLRHRLLQRVLLLLRDAAGRGCEAQAELVAAVCESGGVLGLLLFAVIVERQTVSLRPCSVRATSSAAAAPAPLCSHEAREVHPNQHTGNQLIIINQ